MSDNYIPIKINPELEKIVPAMAVDKRAKLKQSIFERGVQEPVKILGDGTLVDGYNRYRIVEELKAETSKVRSNIVIDTYRVPQSVLQNMSLPEAMLYSIEVNLARRHLNDWQTAKWIVDVNEANKAKKMQPMTEDEMAKKVGLAKATINTTVSLLNKLNIRYKSDPEKMTEYSKGLQNGDGIRTTWNELVAAENFDSEVAKIKDKTFKEEMEVKYANSKYNPTTIKKLETDVTKHDHPEWFTDIEQYYAFAQKVIAQGRKGEEKWEDNVAIMTIKVPEDYKECNQWITQQASENRGFTCICFFYLPEENEKKALKARD